MNGVRDVGVFFGGRSVEHEVSVLTAQQVMAALPGDGFRAVPVYIAKSGDWYTGDALREPERFRDIDRLLGDATPVYMRAEPAKAGVLFGEAGRRSFLGARDRIVAKFDVAMPLVHGSHGEDGTLQGLFELSDLAYTGCGVAASAISMDKRIAKAVLREAGLPVLDDVLVSREQWITERDVACDGVLARLHYPLFVKPASLGSSIGVSRVTERSGLEAAFDLAFSYDSRCIVEAAQDGAVDINCSVLGRDGTTRVSVCEQPVSTGLLTYADKYLSKGKGSAGGKAAETSGVKGSRRVIPAPLADGVATQIQDLAVTAFRAIGAEGVARVDFLVRPDEGQVIVNEINTIPGSLSFYLWEPSGLSFEALLSQLIEMAVTRRDGKRRSTFSIDTWLLRGRPG